MSVTYARCLRTASISLAITSPSFASFALSMLHLAACSSTCDDGHQGKTICFSVLGIVVNTVVTKMDTGLNFITVLLI